MSGDLFRSLQEWQWVPALLARLVVGMMFVLSGYGKLTVPSRREQMRSTMREAGIPAPETAATMVSGVELIFGLLLVLGLLTPLSALMLAGVMVVALATTVLPGVKPAPLGQWLGNVLYLPELLYLVILAWLFFAGAGRASLDCLLGWTWG